MTISIREKEFLDRSEPSKASSLLLIDCSTRLQMLPRHDFVRAIRMDLLPFHRYCSRLET